MSSVALTVLSLLTVLSFATAIACSSEDECGEATYCRGLAEECSEIPECAPLPALGESCGTSADACSSDLCASDLACVDWRCGPPLTTPCASDTDCTADQYCRSCDGAASSCALLPAAGQPCGAGCASDLCALGFYCHHGEHVCRELLFADEALPAVTPSQPDPPPGACLGRPCRFTPSEACQCNTDCADYGDCCADFATVCGADAVPPPPSSALSCAHSLHGCMYNDTTPCQCDASCVHYGDCCVDQSQSECTDRVSTVFSDTTADLLSTTPQPAIPELCLERDDCNFDADAPCQCDLNCNDYGDCCSDFDFVCGSKYSPLLCASRGCGTYDGSIDCQCDAGCAAAGDCCVDWDSVCPAAPASPPPPPGQCPLGTVGINGNCTPYTWTAAPGDGHAPLPLSLAEVSAAVVADTLLLFGDGELETEDNRPTLAYDLRASKWDPVDQRAPRPFWGDHTAVEVYNNELYTFAGLCCQHSCDGCGAARQVQIYNSAANTWRLGTPVPWNLDGAAASAVIGNKIYICGGLNDNIVTALCGIYLPDEDAWAAMPPLPKAVHHTAAGTDGVNFYVFGGRQGSNTLSTPVPDVQVFDPITLTWKSSTDATSGIPPLPTARTGTGHAAFLGGEFYVMGGEWFPNQHRTVLDSGTFDLVEIYNPITRTWRAGTRLPVGLHGLYPVVWNGSIYSGGGSSAYDRGTSTTLLVYAPAP